MQHFVWCNSIQYLGGTCGTADTLGVTIIPNQRGGAFSMGLRCPDIVKIPNIANASEEAKTWRYI